MNHEKDGYTTQVYRNRETSHEQAGQDRQKSSHIGKLMVGSASGKEDTAHKRLQDDFITPAEFLLIIADDIGWF
jgi:hypothetical protein